MFELSKIETDHPEFVKLIGHLIDNLKDRFLPQEVYVVHIDNWFGFKWLGFTGKALGALGFWNRDFRVPPFRPNRVLGQMVWERDATGTKYQSVAKPSLHLEQPSEHNHYRLINRITDSGLFVWYSGQTAATKRGSVMVYQVKRETVHGLYAGFHHTDGWTVHKTNKIVKKQLIQWLQPPFNQQKES